MRTETVERHDQLRPEWKQQVRNEPVTKQYAFLFTLPGTVQSDDQTCSI